MSESRNTQATANEVAALRSQVDQLTAALRNSDLELKRLRAQLKLVETERDDYKNTLFGLLPREELSFSADEIRDLRENGVTWEAIEKDLETIQEE